MLAARTKTKPCRQNDGPWHVAKNQLRVRGDLCAYFVRLRSFDSIIGKWCATSGENARVWNFESGGSITQGGMRGRYRFGDDERIKIETPFATAVYRFQLRGDRLTLIDTNGAKLEFSRVKETGR